MAFNRNTAQEDVESEASYRQALHAIGNDLKEAQDIAMDMGLHKEYGKVEGNSFARFIQLHLRGSEIPIDEKHIADIAYLRGRMDESLRFTSQISSANLKVKRLLKKQSKFENLLALISKRKIKDE